MLTPKAEATATLGDRLRVQPGSRVSMKDLDPRATPGMEGLSTQDAKERAERNIAANVERTAILQQRLYAENHRALLVVLQGMDTSGKDGVIRAAFSGLNPQGCRVTSFKKPSFDEADRDFLWRIHAAVPPKGDIGIFNRAHYEDVLVVRVHNLVPREVWDRRYAIINEFERYLTVTGTTVLKFYLHISRAEQRERLLARLADPEKHWKFSAQDVVERSHWDAYMDAYQDVLERCSTDHAPWYVISSDRKWYRNWAVSEIVRATLEGMNPRIPAATIDPAAFTIPE
jgi:PPK2 family polyphosphate:nucleotide phosphotransferase